MKIKAGFTDCDNPGFLSESFSFFKRFCGSGVCFVGVDSDCGVEIGKFTRKLDTLFVLPGVCADGYPGSNLGISASFKNIFDIVGESVKSQMAVSVDEFHNISGDEGTGIVCDFFPAILLGDYGDNVKAAGFFIDAVYGAEIVCSA